MKRRLASESKDYNSSAFSDELQVLELQFELQSNRRKSAIALARQLREREQLLAGLKAQPLPIVYGAAALGSVGSTLVMHPVDTFKTLQITAAKAAEAEAKAAAAKPSKLKSSAEPPLGKPPFALPPLQDLSFPRLTAGTGSELLVTARDRCSGLNRGSLACPTTPLCTLLKA